RRHQWAALMRCRQYPRACGGARQISGPSFRALSSPCGYGISSTLIKLVLAVFQPARHWSVPALQAPTALNPAHSTVMVWLPTVPEAQATWAALLILQVLGEPGGESRSASLNCAISFPSSIMRQLHPS